MSWPVIVTRAEPGARETAARLERAGYTVIRAPMLRIEPIAPPPDLPTASDLIFTSINGVSAFTAVAQDRKANVWCVGPATAAAARAAGFLQVHESAGGSDELAAFILSDPDAASRTFLHIANETAAGDLVAQLKAGGCHAQFRALYRTCPETALPSAAHRVLDAYGTIMLIHSAKGARAFLAAAGPLSFQKVIAIAISKAAAAPLHAHGFRAILQAAEPNEDSLFDALETATLVLCQPRADMPESQMS